MPDAPNGRVKVGILISGAGSNMAALIDASRAEDCPYEIALVVSNKPDAGGLHVAQAKGISTDVVDHRDFGKDREAHERVVNAVLMAEGVKVVALAGYMRILTPWLVARWAGRMLNVHPSLLPLYPGLDTHARAIEAGDAEAGCTLHIVTDGVDEGPILGQARVPIVAGDTPHSLAERVHVAEHQLYPRVLADFCRDLQQAERH
ncbi:phosphoribosylglycinamide formyltransferase [Brevundimonas goettingensis]|uniref:Phosphoribosylglycinamide formyltransferase n=1 Tax=Brevundimonas goettingensis TaxID=2774190 RepID=A0A975GWC6_9CAUL|nr:phosphoribosylglycinamide formyltransferase [Brevundimonas goettingensis]QTC92442.1 phosphoribosylglycinamide formyltransferase [Brevundimonas goettingensis]